MGRSLFGNSVSAAVTALTRTLGNVDNSIKDSTTQSTTVAIPGGYWGYSSGADYANSNSFRQNTVSEQRLYGNQVGTLQDPLSDYTYVQGPGYYSGNFYLTGVVYDQNLNVVFSWNQNAPLAFNGTRFAVKLYNSALYFFSSTSTGLRVLKVALPSGTITTYDSPALGGNWAPAYSYSLVYNWQIGGKFWIYASQASTSPYTHQIWTFDIATNTFAQFGVSLSRNSGDYLSSTYAMHVNEAGTSVSVAAYSAEGMYGTAVFTASSSSWSGYSGAGNWYYPRTGGYYTFCNNARWKCAVTSEGVLDFGQIPSGSNGTTYYNAIAWMKAGQNVTYNEFAGNTNYTYPFSTAFPHPSLTVKDQVVATYLQTNGTYPVSTASGALVLGSRRSQAYANFNGWGPIQSKLADSFLTGMTNAGVQSTGAYVNSISLSSADDSQYYAFSANVSGQNGWISYCDEIGPTAFVTSAGKFFAFGPYNSQGGQSSTNVFFGQLPVFTPSSTKTYNATVVGGGGASTGNHGTSSSFRGIAANAGQVRTGFVSGSTVFTSGPSRGTGGTGYGADTWGQGEDCTNPSNYGGGSGFVSFGTVTLAANTPYFYRTGFGPIYGKQGAILLSEV